MRGVKHKIFPSEISRCELRCTGVSVVRGCGLIEPPCFVQLREDTYSFLCPDPHQLDKPFCRW